MTSYRFKTHEILGGSTLDFNLGAIKVAESVEWLAGTPDAAALKVVSPTGKARADPCFMYFAEASEHTRMMLFLGTFVYAADADRTVFSCPEIETNKRDTTSLWNLSEDWST